MNNIIIIIVGLIVTVIIIMIIMEKIKCNGLKNHFYLIFYFYSLFYGQGNACHIGFG